MTDPDQISTQINSLHEKVDELQKKKYTDEEIIAELKKEGIAAEYAQQIIQNVENDRADKKSFRNSLIMGSFYIAAGIAINILSYTISANSNVLLYYFFWGIMVLGLVTIIRGFILYK